MILIAPSILAVNPKNLINEIKKIEKAGGDWLHVDVMDGKFVPQKTIFVDPQKVKQISKHVNLPLDVHLMVENPENYIKNFVQAGADYLSIHFESKGNLLKAIKLAKNYGAKAGIAVNPETPWRKLKTYIQDIDFILLMSVKPGKGGQKYVRSVTKKIHDLKQYLLNNKLNVLIQVDGGIKENNAYQPINAGADIIVSGSGIFKATSYQKTISRMKEVLLIGSDHGGFLLKQKIKNEIDKMGIAHKDVGCYSGDSCDYPDFAKMVVKKINNKEAKRGILICGTGIGMSIAANRFKNIRATLCHNRFTAEMSRRHNNSNILILGGRTTGPVTAKKIINIWANTLPDRGRHQKRINLIDNLDTIE